MGKPVMHFEIAAKDAARMQGFYRDLFDWQVDASNPMGYGVVTTGATGINGGIMQAKDPNFTYVTFYVQVEDLQACLNKAEGLGGRIMLPPTPVPGIGMIAFFADPEENPIGLFCPNQ